MNHDRIITPGNGSLGPTRATARAAMPGYRRESQFHITVIATTSKGTLAALKTAAGVAKTLSAPITLAMIEVLRPHLSLEPPRFMIDFLEKRAFALVSDAGIRDQAVTIQIWFCHDRKKCLRQALDSRTLAVVGGTRHWFRRDERKLEEWLSRQGYPTIFADASANNNIVTEILPNSHRHAILHQLVKHPDKKTGPAEAT